jgi:hypothetical protein
MGSSFVDTQLRCSGAGAGILKATTDGYQAAARYAKCTTQHVAPLSLRTASCGPGACQPV